MSELTEAMAAVADAAKDYGARLDALEARADAMVKPGTLWYEAALRIIERAKDAGDAAVLAAARRVVVAIRLGKTVDTADMRLLEAFD